MVNPTIIAEVERKYLVLRPCMDERTRRRWAAAEASAIGRGGVTTVALATGISRTTITAGQRENKEPPPEAGSPIRRAGGGRKSVTELDPELLHALESLVDPVSRGDPESPLRWTLKSTRRLADELTRQDHRVSPRTVAGLLYAAGYSLQSNRKTREGQQHPDRNAQFQRLSDPDHTPGPAQTQSIATQRARQKQYARQNPSQLHNMFHCWADSVTPVSPGYAA